MLIKQDHMATMPSGNPAQDAPNHSASQEPPNERSLDDIIVDEQTEIAADNEKAAAAASAKQEATKDVADKGGDSKNEGEADKTKDETGEGLNAVEEGLENDDDEDDSDYKANAKYKVLDKEHEFDPKLAKLLTKETEPVIRELYEKAHGIETIKEKLQHTRGERDQYQEQFQQLGSEVNRIMGYRKAGDLDSFFEALEMNPVDVAKWVMQKAEIENLPPEAKAVYTEREMLRRRMNAMEQQLHSTSSRAESEAVQARIGQLSDTLAKPEHVTLVKSFDERNGQGSFQKAVMDHAAAQWHATKKDLSVPEAIASFMKTYGIQAPAQATASKPAPGAAPTNRVVSKPKAKTIPNLGRSQASVTAEAKPKSVDDLRKIYKEKYA